MTFNANCYYGATKYGDEAIKNVESLAKLVKKQNRHLCMYIAGDIAYLIDILSTEGLVDKLLDRMEYNKIIYENIFSSIKEDKVFVYCYNDNGSIKEKKINDINKKIEYLKIYKSLLNNSMLDLSLLRVIFEKETIKAQEDCRIGECFLLHGYRLALKINSREAVTFSSEKNPEYKITFNF